MSWTYERVEKLKQLWEEGLTASRIAAELAAVAKKAAEESRKAAEATKRALERTAQSARNTGRRMNRRTRGATKRFASNFSRGGGCVVS